MSSICIDQRACLGDDLYSRYRHLRETDPVSWNDELQGWHVTRYSHVNVLLRDKKLSATRSGSIRGGCGASRATAWMDACLRHWMIFKEPPEHGRLRNTCNRSFTDRMIQSLAPQVEAFIDTLIDRLPTVGTVDFIESFAYPLPSMVIGQILGIETGRLTRLTGCAADMVEAFGTGRPTLQAAKSYQHVTGYFSDLIERGNLSPVLQAFVDAAGEGVVSTEELLTNCAFLLLAGLDTTINFIANGLLSLLRNPAEFERLRADDSVAPRAVEELLRFESPIQYVSRWSSTEFPLGNRTIRSGDRLVLSIGAANHDPAQFTRPDELDLDREQNPHLAFISGVHYCLGAPLARLEGCLVLRALVRRFRHLEVAGPVMWKPDAAIRSLKCLPVRVHLAAC